MGVPQAAVDALALAKARLCEQYDDVVRSARLAE
jgi:hypothetical protein